MSTSVCVRRGKQQKRKATGSGDESEPKRPCVGCDIGASRAPGRVSELATDTVLVALEFFDSASLLAATLVCPRWNEIMIEAGRRRVRLAERAWLPVCPGRQSRPKFIPVERFYRLQFLGALGVWCPRPGRAVISANHITLPVPFPMALPYACAWDAITDAVPVVPGSDDFPHGIVVRVTAEKTLELTAAVKPDIDTAADAIMSARKDGVWQQDLSARVGPWVVCVLADSGPPRVHRPLEAWHAETLAPCRGAQWVAGRSTVVTAVDDPPHRRLISVSPSCAVLYEQPPSSLTRIYPLVPRFVLWCSPRSGSDELVVRPVPEVADKDRRLNVGWDLAPHDFVPTGAVVAIRPATVE